jgi:3-oxoacyl-[acyl-carrier-protein] synthase-1
VGRTAFASAAAVRAAISIFNDHPYMIDKAGDPMVVAMDAFLSAELTGPRRFLELGLSAAEEALGTLRGKQRIAQQLEILIGLPRQRTGLPDDLVNEIVHGFQEHFAKPRVEMVRCDHCGGLMALEEGWRRIANGTVSFCLVGGIDSYLEPETLEWLDAEGQLHSEANSWGFIPGEGAGFCLLCSERTAQQFGLPVRGEILFAVTARETNLIKTESVCIGEGLTEAIRKAALGLPPKTRINKTICDLNGEPYRGNEWGYSLVRVAEHFVDPTDFMTPADCWGDVGAASGPLLVILAAVAGLKGYANGPHTMIFTSAETGERTAALVRCGRHGKDERAWE